MDRKSLGQILASELTPATVPIEPVESYFTRPTKQSPNTAVSLKEF